MDHYVILDYIYERDTKYSREPLISRRVYKRNVLYIDTYTRSSSSSRGSEGKNGPFPAVIYLPISLFLPYEGSQRAYIYHFLSYHSWERGLKINIFNIIYQGYRPRT